MGWRKTLQPEIYTDRKKLSRGSQLFMLIKIGKKKTLLISDDLLNKFIYHKIIEYLT